MSEKEVVETVSSKEQEERTDKKPRDGPKKEAVLDLAKYKDQRIIVTFVGGREVAGTLKGYDQLMNLVLDEVVETLKDTETGAKTGERTLGLIVVRSTGLLTISPAEGSEIIDNPFVTAAQE